MKFPRNARVFRGQLDVAPFAALFFLLVLFLMLTSLTYTPGVALELPLAPNLPGTDRPTISVAVDANGTLYFENQVIGEVKLGGRLRQAVRDTPDGLTLVVEPDKAVPYATLLRLTLLARRAGISNVLLGTLPRSFDSTYLPAPR